MTSEKFVAFTKKLLEKTKTGNIKWSRCPTGCRESWASPLRSFSCAAGSMQVDMLSSEEFDDVQFNIQYDESLPSASWKPDSEEEKQVALRLMNYVYNQFPNLEKSIDEFLKDF